MNKPLIYEDPLRSQAERIAAVGYDYTAQEKEWIRECNLCGAQQWTVLARRDRYGFPAQATGCEVCGLTILNPRMTAAAYAHFYDGIYRPLVSAFYGRRIDALTIQAEQRTYASEIEQCLGPFLDGRHGGTFLDVGGSTGVVAAHFSRRFAFKATVLDPAPQETREAEALGIDTITALAEEWEPEGLQFDIIGMFQTIDHLLDVAGTLRKLRTAIREDGLFVVDIVDFRAAYLRERSVPAALKIDHPYSLTQDTAEAVLARAGFEPVGKAFSADQLHVAYVCRPCDPLPEALPPRASVERYYQELRCLEDEPRSDGGPR
jgi:SAM-dependent methyltransferase